MSGVFRNIDPPPPHPPHRPASVYPPAFGGGGEDTLAGWRGGWGSIVRQFGRRQTPCTVLYTIYVSTLYMYLMYHTVYCSWKQLCFYLYVYTLFLSFLNLSPPPSTAGRTFYNTKLYVFFCVFSPLLKTFSSLLLCSILSLSLSFSSFPFRFP